jgi:hypothetical protein
VLIYWNKCYLREQKAADSEGRRLIQFSHPYKKPIVWFYEFGMFLDYDSVGIKRNGVDSFLKENLNPMQLLFYSSRDDQNKERLEAAVHKVIPENKVELFKRLDDFRERLRMPIEPDSIAVLSASNREDLQQMQLLRGLLTEIYIVLVIPDRKASTIRLAHLLLPRFLSQKESDFSDLKMVLNKMFINSQYSHDEKLFQES